MLIEQKLSQLSGGWPIRSAQASVSIHSKSWMRRLLHASTGLHRPVLLPAVDTGQAVTLLLVKVLGELWRWRTPVGGHQASGGWPIRSATWFATARSARNQATIAVGWNKSTLSPERTGSSAELTQLSIQTGWPPRWRCCRHSPCGASTCSFAARTRPRTISRRANSARENGCGQAVVNLWPNWYGWSWSAAPVPSLLSCVDGVRSCSAIRPPYLEEDG